MGEKKEKRRFFYVSLFLTILFVSKELWRLDFLRPAPSNIVPRIIPNVVSSLVEAAVEQFESDTF